MVARKLGSKSIIGVALATLACGLDGAHAQQTQSSPQPANSTTSDEIVVTATRREATIQNLPMAVTALAGVDLERDGLRDTTALQQASPSLVITTSNSEATGAVIRLRGVGTSANNTGLEGSVGVFVDGMYLSRSGIALNDLLDVQRVEVLRGPQGTLFGKNTSAGAINIVTRAPEYEFDGAVSAGFSTFDGIRYTGSITAPLIEDRLAFRISGLVNQRDGFIEDAISGETTNNRDRFLVRAQSLLTLSDKADLRFSIDYAEKNENCCGAPYVSYSATTLANLNALGARTFQPAEEYTVAVNRPITNDTEEVGYQANLNWDLDWSALSVIVGTRNYVSNRSQDADYNNLDIQFTTDRLRDRFTSMEATLQGEAGPLDWLVGAYQFKEDLLSTGTGLFGADAGRWYARIGNNTTLLTRYPAGAGDRARYFEQNSEGWSLFTHNTLNMTDKLSLTVGLRYLEETKDGEKFIITDIPTPVPATGTRCTVTPASLRIFCPVGGYVTTYSDEQTTGVAALRYAFTSSVSAYASYSKGFKAGGLNADRTSTLASGGATFQPEQSESYEIGIRTRFPDQKLTANLTLYQTMFTDFQLNTFTGTEFIISNAAAVTSEGVEFEGRWAPIQGISLNSGFAYNFAEYGNETVDATLRGRQLNSAPKWTAQYGAAFDRGVTNDLSLVGSFNARYQSAVNTGSDLAPQKVQEAYTLVNGRLAMRFDKRDVEISVWSNNIFDQYYRTIVFNTPTQQSGSFNTFLGEPRTIGLEVRANF